MKVLWCYTYVVQWITSHIVYLLWVALQTSQNVRDVFLCLYPEVPLALRKLLLQNLAAFTRQRFRRAAAEK